MIATILLAIPGFVLLWAFINYVEHLISLRKYPKGPFPLPLVGNVLLLSKRPYMDFIELGKTYGDVFSFSFGMNRAVILNKYDVIKEALMARGTDFAGRPSTDIPSKITSRNFTSLGHCDYSKSWAFLRKVSYKSLHIYGSGMKRLEDLITEEVDKMCSTLSRDLGKPILIDSYIGNSLINTICHMCFSKTYDFDDPEFAHIMGFFKMINDGSLPGQAISIFPWLQYFPDTERFKNLKLGSKQRHDYANKMFNEHIATFDPHNIRDLTDNLLHFSQNKEMWKDAGFEKVTQEQLESVVSSIMFAGVETQSATFRWLLLFMLHHPEYQTKIYEEIKSNVGLKRRISPEDKEVATITSCVILETHRMASVGPLSLPHKTTVDTSVGGHTIPKNTTIFTNLYSMHYDPTHWDEPEKFKPERWLNADGSLKKEKATHYLPFSAGTRVCLAEKMAQLQLFMITTNFFRNFEVSLAPGEQLPSLKDGVMGITLNPPRRKIILTRRKHN
ncbi:steroid 17-alpha-hydroxylase/17,20 lyase-like [Clytia hemisphaerica]|uniref:Uncharacterized protein n=1 Tax=Clytia hemisphaerica TaxID=252671 RepID=A0A7M6DL16_9CNID